MNSYSVHQRNASQGQQLILESRESGDDESGVITKTLASPSHPMSSLVSEVASTASSQPALTVPSDAGHYCKDPKLRDNLRVVIGSILLTIIGTVLLVVGAIAVLMPTETGLRGWVFLFAGFLFFVPGIYHVVYIVCTLCGRPGYSFNSLPTFNK
uniref:Transmembrane protein 134 n=1 Tax=Parascaris univalens TaxID=6257 RepID=A0A915BV74_PARUN